MAIKDCIDEIFHAAAGALTRGEIDENLDEVERRFARRQRQNPMESPAESANVVGAELSREAKVAAIIEKRSRAINLMRRQDIRIPIAQQADKVAALDALTTGASTGEAGRSSLAGRGVHQRFVQRHGALASPMFGQLERKGYAKLMNRDKDFTRQVAAEIWRQSEPDNPRLPKQTRPEAVEAAGIIGRTIEMGRKIQNDAGAWIGKLPGYVLRNDWDMMRVRKVSPQEFQQDILDNIDMEKSFDDPSDAESVVRTVNGWHASLSTGIHEGAHGGEDWLTGFKGPANRGKKISAHREIHWLGPDQMMAMHDKYGGGKFLESVDKGLEKAARNAALMEVFGTNPQAMFDDTMNWIADTAKTSGDVKTVDATRAYWKSKAKFSIVNGTANQGGNPKLASVVGFANGWQSLTNLGMVTVSAITDLPLTAGTLRQSGIGYFEGVANQLMTVLEGWNTEEQQEIAEHLHIMFDGTVGDFGSRFAAPDGPRGWMAKTLKTFFKYNGITHWTDRMKSGVGLALSRNLAKMSVREFADLPERLRGNLARYGVGEREWGLVKQIELEEARGLRYLTADGADRLPDEAVGKWLGESDTVHEGKSPEAVQARIAAAKADITSKLGTYFTDQVDEAVNQPGAYERFATTLGQPAGTPMGAALRAFMQFKTFGVSATRRHFGRDLFRQTSVDKTGLALLILGTTTMGYAAMQAKLLMSGKTRPLPTNPVDIASQVGAAFAQGGGAGIYGDFLLGDYNRFGQGAIETLGGPQVGSLSDALKMFSILTSKKTLNSVTGEDGEPAIPKDVKANALNLVRHNLPFQNFVWTKTALDYLIFYHMQEAMNPGYLHRMEQRTQKDQGVGFWLRPSAVAR